MHTYYRRVKDKSNLRQEIKIPVEDHYVHCYVWETKQAMYDNVIAPSDFLAMFFTMKYRVHVQTGIPDLKPKIGEIHLFEDFLGAGILAHEITHLVLQWADIHDLDISDDDVHERLCTIAEIANRKFWNEYIR